MPTTAIARRAESVLTWKARRDAAAPGPRALGAATAAFGRVEALRVPALRHLAPYNKARGLSAGSLRRLPAIVDFFAGAGADPAVEVWEGDAGAGLTAALTAAGFVPAPRTATLYRDPAGAGTPAVPRGLTVEEVPPGDPGPQYLRTLADGYGFAGEAVLTMLAAEHEAGAVRRYLVRADGVPAAAGSLCATPHGVLLCGAATLPAYRRTGCQGALIARRLADAADLADLAVVTVADGSASHANLARAGFRTAHTRTVWLRRSRRSGG